MNKWLIVAMALVFLLSEIALQINPVWGFLFHVILLSGLLLGISFEREDEYKLLLFLMILPIVRVAGVLVDVPDFWRVMLSYYLLVFLALFYSFSFKLNVGFNSKKIGFMPIVLIIGFVLGYVCEKITGLKLESTLILVASVISFSEELFFRGLIQKNLREYGMIFCIFISALLYGIFSLGLGWKFALMAFALGVLSSVTYEITDNLFLSILMNFSFQMTLILLQ